MNALPVIDQTDAPEGCEWRWEPVKDGTGYCGDFRVVAEVTGKLYRCRWGAGPGNPACGRPSVAKLNRGHGHERWWHYCEDHLYGRVLVDGVIYSKVLRPLDGEA